MAGTGGLPWPDLGFIVSEIKQWQSTWLKAVPEKILQAMGGGDLLNNLCLETSPPVPRYTPVALSWHHGWSTLQSLSPIHVQKSHPLCPGMFPVTGPPPNCSLVSFHSQKSPEVVAISPLPPVQTFHHAFFFPTTKQLPSKPSPWQGGSCVHTFALCGFRPRQGKEWPCCVAYALQWLHLKPAKHLGQQHQQILLQFLRCVEQVVQGHCPGGGGQVSLAKLGDQLEVVHWVGDANTIFHQCNIWENKLGIQFWKTRGKKGETESTPNRVKSPMQTIHMVINLWNGTDSPTFLPHSFKLLGQ